MHSFTWWHYFQCLITLKLCLGKISTKFKYCMWGFTGIVVCYFRPHLNLPKMFSLLMLHLLPCLTTFNIVGYINKIKLNKSRNVGDIAYRELIGRPTIRGKSASLSAYRPINRHIGWFIGWFILSVRPRQAINRPIYRNIGRYLEQCYTVDFKRKFWLAILLLS